MRLMGIDYGDRRVGVAVSDPLGLTAQGVCTVENTGGKKLYARLAELIAQYEVDKLVVGLPKNMDNSSGTRVEATMAFVERLKTVTDAEIVLSDERLTTVEAHGYLSEMNIRGKKRKDVVDTVAATLILDNYMRRIQG